MQGSAANYTQDYGHLLFHGAKVCLNPPIYKDMERNIEKLD